MAPALHISQSGAPTWNPCFILFYCTTLVFERVRLQMESLLHRHEGLHDERLRTLMLCFGMGLFPLQHGFTAAFWAWEILGSNMIWTSFYHGPLWRLDIDSGREQRSPVNCAPADGQTLTSRLPRTCNLKLGRYSTSVARTWELLRIDETKSRNQKDTNGNSM